MKYSAVMSSKVVLLHHSDFDCTNVCCICFICRLIEKKRGWMDGWMVWAFHNHRRGCSASTVLTATAQLNGTHTE